ACIILAAASWAQAATYEATISLGRLKLNSLSNSRLLGALDKSLDGGCCIRMAGNRLMFRLDRAKLPRSLKAAEKDARIFTGEAAPDATARQFAHYGLFLPRRVDPSQPLTILIHGLD